MISVNDKISRDVLIIHLDFDIAHKNTRLATLRRRVAAAVFVKLLTKLMVQKDKLKKHLFDEKRDKDTNNENNRFFLYIVIVFLVLLALYSRYDVEPNQFKMTEVVQWIFSRVYFDKDWNNARKNQNKFSSIMTPILFGIVITVFSWMIVFFDSSLPGICPPSPLSPSKLRKQSGHTFHSSYVMALINGVACSILISCWI